MDNLIEQFYWTTLLYHLISYNGLNMHLHTVHMNLFQLTHVSQNACVSRNYISCVLRGKKDGWLFTTHYFTNSTTNCTKWCMKVQWNIFFYWNVWNQFVRMNVQLWFFQNYSHKYLILQTCAKVYVF